MLVDDTIKLADVPGYNYIWVRIIILPSMAHAMHFAAEYELNGYLI